MAFISAHGGVLYEDSLWMNTALLELASRQFTLENFVRVSIYIILFTGTVKVYKQLK